MTAGVHRPGKKQKEKEKEGGLVLGRLGRIGLVGPKPFFIYLFSNLTENFLLFVYKTSFRAPN
jgi:hypothetical protein